MRPFSLLIKPTSADCNLRCEYCFYLKKSSLYPESIRHRMSDEVLKQLIKSYMATSQSTYSFTWQGGEPTLMGLDFFHKVVALQKQYGAKGAIVANGLQTNATHINEELAHHFALYRFLLGCSLDGSEVIHDRYRRTLKGKGTHEMVLSGIDTLRRYGIEFNILVLVSKANVEQASEIYQYLRKKGFYYHQYVPCVEFDEDGKPLPFAINGQEWGEFLCGLFDEWYPNDMYKVSIRLFDSVLQKMVDGAVNVCQMDRNCCQYFVVEYNGDIYPCDFFVEAPLKIGNIMDTSWDEAIESRIYQNFGSQKSNWNKKCQTCDCLNYCLGDCLKHRIYSGNASQNLSWLCEGWRRFYRSTRGRLQTIADEIRQGHKTSNLNVAQKKSYRIKPSRNAPCLCGSGKKYKKCCVR